MATNRRFMPAPPDTIWAVLEDPASYAYWVVGSKRMATFDDMQVERKLSVYDKGFDQSATGWGEYIMRSGDDMPLVRGQSYRVVVSGVYSLWNPEKWAGTGYPDRLTRDAIPPAARVVALADAYDGLRRPTGDDSGLEHLDAVDALFDDSPGHFDPVVLDAFKAVHYRFNEIFTTIPD